MTTHAGPSTPFSQRLHATKYRGKGESFHEAMTRIANALTDTSEDFYAFRDILSDQRFLPGGRIQAAIGSPKSVTAFNCFVSGTVEDSMKSIMERATEAAFTMRTGGGIGYDFSNLRPRGDWISTLDSVASGPISFMGIFDALCQTISSAGHRRGAQMGVLRVDHPDIEEFIQAKQNTDRLTAFNVSIGVTDEFMEAVKADANFDLMFEGNTYNRVKARNLWDRIMRSTWDWAEPGVVFLDTINKMNNLYYCEEISATNPCGEQPLPPFGACLLGSFNLVKYITEDRCFDYIQFGKDIKAVVPAMDRVIDVTDYPLKPQKADALLKRRMGLGITGLANALEAMGAPYASDKFFREMRMILGALQFISYCTSVELARERGAFPMFDRDYYTRSKFLRKLPNDLVRDISQYGIRNSHLLSIAPTGTISMCADNVSSGIEPVYSYVTDRVVQTMRGPAVERVEDYGVKNFGIKGRTATEVSGKEHVVVLCVAQEYVDSAVSKTVNVDPATPWGDFKDLYDIAWSCGAKGCTTFNPGGKRMGILTEVKTENEGAACRIDPDTGVRTCDE